MRSVHQHANAVHLGHDLQPPAGEAAISPLRAAVAHVVAGVVGKQHVPHAKVVEGLHELQLAFEHVGFLEVEHQAELA